MHILLVSFNILLKQPLNPKQLEMVQKININNFNDSFVVSKFEYAF